MNRHGTVTSLQQVDHSCPTCLHCEISLLEHSRPKFKAEMHDWILSLPSDKHDVTLPDTHIAIRANILTDVSALLTWSPQNPSPFLSSLTLIYSTGPWTKENLITAVEFFFQRNAYHPFAQCSHPQQQSDPVPPTEILQENAETATADRKMLHYFTQHVCADLDNFCSNRKEVNNMEFLDKSKIFSYRTIGLWETIRNPITFREFSRYVIIGALVTWAVYTQGQLLL